MTNLTDSAVAPGSRKAEETTEQERIDRAAEELAEQASKVEQHYDNDHNIFTK